MLVADLKSSLLNLIKLSTFGVYATYSISGAEINHVEVVILESKPNAISAVVVSDVSVMLINEKEILTEIGYSKDFNYVDSYASPKEIRCLFDKKDKSSIVIKEFKITNTQKIYSLVENSPSEINVLKDTTKGSFHIFSNHIIFVTNRELDLYSNTSYISTTEIKNDKGFVLIKAFNSIVFQGTKEVHVATINSADSIDKIVIEAGISDFELFYNEYSDKRRIAIKNDKTIKLIDVVDKSVNYTLELDLNCKYTSLIVSNSLNNELIYTCNSDELYFQGTKKWIKKFDLSSIKYSNIISYDISESSARIFENKLTVLDHSNGSLNPASIFSNLAFNFIQSLNELSSRAAKLFDKEEVRHIKEDIHSVIVLETGGKVVIVNGLSGAIKAKM